MKIVFMGTPDFAAAALEALVQEGHEVTAVVTQPDKAKGRSKEPVYSPVKECALRHGIPVMQPVKIKTPEAIAELKTYEADVYVVAAFGQILSQEILDIPKYRSINIHASLLPKYRGASPIQHVLIDGEEKTGITIMQMDAGIDTGDMLYTKELVIDSKDNFETLHDKLCVMGAEAIVEALALLEQGKLVAVAQDHEKSCYAGMIRKEMGNIDFSKSATEIERLIRGMNPWPSAYTFYKGKQMKIWEADVVTDAQAGAPGEIVCVTKEGIVVATGEGALVLRSIQLEGKKRMPVRDFLIGQKVSTGECFASER